MWNEELFTKTMLFAIDKHKNQVMKYPENMPYSAHIFGVTERLINNAIGDKNINWNLAIQVALLHDTLEDTDTSYDELVDNFGRQVADGVLAVTKNDNLPKEMQMKDCIVRIKKQPKEIAMVKLADRLFNIDGRVPTWSTEKQEAYKKEAIMICDELGFASNNLRNALLMAIKNY